MFLSKVDTCNLYGLQARCGLSFLSAKEGVAQTPFTLGTKAFTAEIAEYAEDSTKPLGLISAVFAPLGGVVNSSPDTTPPEAVK